MELYTSEDAVFAVDPATLEIRKEDTSIWRGMREINAQSTLSHQLITIHNARAAQKKFVARATFP
jgi:hypothetical protein